MTVTGASLAVRFPGALGALSTTVLDAAVAEAYLRAPAARLGDRLEIAVQYLAAHLALLDRRAASDGIASASADGVSTSFRGASDQANTFLDEYERILGTGSAMSGMAISSFAAWGFP